MNNKKTPAELRKDFWNKDQLNGGVIRRQYEEIKNVLKNQDFEFVRKQLRLIKEHAIKNTDFYSRYTIDSEFPVMNKIKLIENKDACTAKCGFDLPLHISSTSGSTGTPFSVAQNYTKRMRTIADLKVFGELADYPSHECMVFYRALVKKNAISKDQQNKENIFYVDCSDLSEYGLENMVQALLKIKPRTILSCASVIVELAKYIKIYHNKIEKSYIESIIIGGEVIAEKERKYIEEVFECKVYKRYSDMELGILGQDQGDGKNYILNYGSYYFECLKIDSDKIADDGEVGRIVITDLFNYAFPMIRYDTGDLGIMKYLDTGFPQLVTIYGRRYDSVYDTNGKMISPHKIINEMWGAYNIKQWQLIQQEEKIYILKLNCSGKIDEDIYLNLFKRILGDSAVIVLKFVNENPELNSNKRRAIICNYHKNS